VDIRPAPAIPCEPSPEPAIEESEAAIDERWLARIRWRCRRGMLENDLILERFLNTRAAAMSPADVAALDALLDYSDNDLWALLSDRAEPADAALLPLVRYLRSI
jgi:antitoxin CptB